MAGSLALARVLQPIFLLGVFTLLGIGQYVTARVRIIAVCTTVAAALDLLAADGGGRAARGLRLLGVGLSAASWFILFEPGVGYIIACSRLGCRCDCSVELMAAGVVGMAAVVGLHVFFAAVALFGR